MDLATRKSLTQSLSKLSVEIAATLRIPMRSPGPVQDAARTLHREEQVGEAYDLWTDLLARRAAVLWILRSLYVRILEDRGLLQPRRIVDAEDDLFRHLAPNLGPTAYLRWVHRDLASLEGGLPELFAPQPAEVAPVPDALSQKLLDFWRSKDPDTGALRYRFNDEHFDSRLMGDLYQDLDPVVKKRYALLQTPDFVLDFILDETLTPAIAEWGVETVRVLDPACGSGHFLLAAFQRVVAGMRAKFPERPVREVVQDVLSRVVGIDLNDYACALARARLVMTALETCQETDLAAASAFHPKVFWADALEQVEEDEQLGLTEIAAEHRASMGMLTPPEVRASLRPELKNRFHVAVGNPPYDQEKDLRRREYHRATVRRKRRYISANGKYSLSAPFIERMLDLSVPGGRLGILVGNTFMRKPFGRALVRQVLARNDITRAVDLSGVRFAGPGVPTIILLLRHRRPAGRLHLVVGKKSSPKSFRNADQPSWRSILVSTTRDPYEDEYISARRVDQEGAVVHPWTLADAAEASLKIAIESVQGSPLRDMATLGVIGMTNAGECLILTDRVVDRMRVPTAMRRSLCEGEDIRAWAIRWSREAIFPYANDGSLIRDSDDLSQLQRALWAYRTTMWARATFEKGTYRSEGRTWWEWHQLAHERVRPVKLLYPELSTNPSFVPDASGGLAVQDVFVIVPSVDDGEASLSIAAVLNSSVGLFWIKKVFQNKGYSAGKAGRVTAEPWDNFYQASSTALGPFVIPANSAPLRDIARSIASAQEVRRINSCDQIVARESENGANALRAAFAVRRGEDTAAFLRVVALHEELDWVAYDIYGFLDDDCASVPKIVVALRPGLRPFEVTLAQDDVGRCEALARGEEPDEAPTQWFARHGWEPHPTLDALPESERAIVQARIEATEASRELSLLEQPTYKRRWYKPDYEKEESEAMELWLDDRLEAWGKERPEPFSAAQAGAAFRADPAVLAVGELLTGRPDFDVDALIEERLRLAAVPNLKHHVFKAEGLLKRAEWEKTWEEQHKEDRGERAAPAVPPKYDSKDFLKSEYWSLRGKLDVPKERFVAFTEVPSPVGVATLYGWAGWTPRERAKAMLGLDEKLESAGVSVADRHGLLYGVWFLLPYVAWESPEAARDFRADVKSVVGENGVTEAMLDEWAKRFPPPKGGGPAKTKAVAPVSAAGEKPKRSKRTGKAKEELSE